MKAYLKCMYINELGVGITWEEFRFVQSLDDGCCCCRCGKTACLIGMLCWMGADFKNRQLRWGGMAAVCTKKYLEWTGIF